MVFIMKTMIIGLMMMGLAGAALAIEPAQLDNRIRELSAQFEMMQSRPNQAIPPDVLRRARGIVLLDRTKAGFLFAYEGGGGIAMVRDSKTDNWSPAAFVSASDASLGFQIGGEKVFYVVLLMNRDATRLITEPNYKFAGEARGTAGDVSAGDSAKVSTLNQPVLIYNSRTGLYGGAVIQGGDIRPDDKANRIYYNQYLTAGEILFEHKVQPSDSTKDLSLKLDKYSTVPANPPAAR